MISVTFVNKKGTYGSFIQFQDVFETEKKTISTTRDGKCKIVLPDDLGEVRSTEEQKVIFHVGESLPAGGNGWTAKFWQVSEYLWEIELNRTDIGRLTDIISYTANLKEDNGPFFGYCVYDSFIFEDPPKGLGLPIELDSDWSIKIDWEAVKKLGALHQEI